MEFLSCPKDKHSALMHCLVNLHRFSTCNFIAERLVDRMVGLGYLDVSTLAENELELYKLYGLGFYNSYLEEEALVALFCELIGPEYWS
jgi:hypothetical protein